MSNPQASGLGPPLEEGQGGLRGLRSHLWLFPAKSQGESSGPALLTLVVVASSRKGQGKGVPALHCLCPFLASGDGGQLPRRGAPLRLLHLGRAEG